MEKQKTYPTWEHPAFLVVITLVGGYMNAYTYMTRDGILSNMHTANMSHLGINLALGNWGAAGRYFLPIVACILGAAFSELTKKVISASRFPGDWRKGALVLEAAALFCVGLAPLSVPNVIVTEGVSFFMGFQLCLFRSCMGIAHNTTICTGNIRNVGQRLFQALEKRDSASFRMLGMFAALTFSFGIGAVPGTIASVHLQEKAVWVCSAVLLFLAGWIARWERHHAS